MSFVEIVGRAPVLTDGAWGTELQNRGLAPGDSADHWNLLHPDRVADVAASYVEAGSAVILTNTFRANAMSLAAYGLEGNVRQINTAGARLSREAAAGRALVFGSLGPTGELLSVTGRGQQARAAFTEQAAALAEAGVDALLFETFSDIEEAKLALDAAHETGLPLIVSFAFDSGRNGDRTMTGATPEQAARELTDAGADAVGANCGTGITSTIEICRRMRDATHLPIWSKPNAGLPELVGGAVRYRTTPEEFASHIPALLRAGVAFAGACCGSSSSFIRAAARVVATYKQEKLYANQSH